MRKYRFSSKAPEPRALCVSHRDIAPVISRCLRYEFEDLIGAMDAVDVIAPADTPAPTSAGTPAQKAVHTVRWLAVKTLRRLMVKLEGTLPFTGLRRRPSGLKHDYELLLITTESIYDLYDIGPCAMWRSLARVSICQIDEIYVKDLPALGDLLKILKRFDHILVGQPGTVEALSAATGRPCHYLAPSTDTLKFCPYPTAPERVIDFYAMGSCPPETHKALLRMAEAGDWFYLYNTASNCPVSYADHRSHVAELIKRSRFFLANAARWHDPERTGGQQVLGFRFFEGSAAGTVLIGDAPFSDETFKALFDWPDAVIPLPCNSGDVAEVIAELDADPSRLERASKNNVANSLRRHDHVHRWGQVLAIAGLKETSAMENRRRELEEAAASIDCTIPVTR
jgi:hypothetical protein